VTILTPDFYSYRWLPLTRADRVVDGALIECPDAADDALRADTPAAETDRKSEPPAEEVEP